MSVVWQTEHEELILEISDILRGLSASLGGKANRGWERMERSAFSFLAWHEVGDAWQNYDDRPHRPPVMVCRNNLTGKYHYSWLGSLAKTSGPCNTREWAMHLAIEAASRGEPL